MTALVQVLSRFSTSSNPEIEVLKLLAILCGIGLSVSIIFAAFGLDLSGGFFLTGTSLQSGDLLERFA
jgi:hypothetical protein